MAEEAPDLSTQNAMTTGVDDDQLLDALSDSDGGGEALGDQGGTTTQGFMSAEQVQQLLNNQTQMITDHLQQINRPAAPPPVQQTVDEGPDPAQLMPTAQEVRQAFEGGDSDAFINVYNRGLQAVYTAAERRIADLERAGTQRIQQIAQDSVQGVVPDEYRDEVNRIMDEFNLDPTLRTNRQVLGVLTDAARGRNMPEEVNRAIEARVRQASNRRTAEPTTNRTARGTEPDEPVFGMEAISALRRAGRTTDQHAQQLGYDNWDAYVSATQEKYDTWQERSVPTWRRRLNERRTRTGRRGAA